ncbi:GntR family transcriptional regulator [Variovorax sp. J31P207]|uniref:FadR/GntR family transcriptional regulator n=1 Tax=Variovorax sp. J31P207 TaxID=3053510 RepID=UPI00257674D7|nr:GntR family transcriptional regulator [Variovorax sp. J31P207]MDM0069953.1 GntR family transcriptional regulator [Variovorax sp. J31P207]
MKASSFRWPDIGHAVIMADMPLPLSPRSATASASNKRPKAAEVVASELRRQIVTGRLKPGDQLQPEHVLRSEFEISRPTMREALRLLESESLITISRGKHGGARVSSVDLGAVARQVGVFLQLEGTTLADVWLARTLIEPPAAGLIAARPDPEILASLESNIDEARQAAKVDLIRYAELSAEFSMLITRHCGSNTIHLLSALISDIIRRQHEHVTEQTRERGSVDRLREESLRAREKAVELMRKGKVVEIEKFWRMHLEHMRDLVLAAYDGRATIDVLTKPVGKLRSIGKVRRQEQPVSTSPAAVKAGGRGALRA